MSEMYYNPNPANVLAGGGHQSRLCPICRESVHARKSISVDLGGGLESMVHVACLHGIDPTQPTAPAKPAATTRPASKRPVSKAAPVKRGYGQITHTEPVMHKSRPYISMNTLAKLMNHGTAYTDGTLLIDADALADHFTPDEILALAEIGMRVQH